MLTDKPNYGLILFSFLTTFMLDHVFVGLGLTEKETRVYLALLGMGSAGLSDISEKSGLNRTSLYPLLRALLQKKFLTISVKGKRKLYTAEPPNSIKALLKDKLSLFEDSLPTLLTMAHASPVKPVITFREGFEGVKEAFRDSLKCRDKVVLIFSSPDALTRHKHQALKAFWEKEYIPKRTKLGRSVNIIFPDGEVARTYQKMNEKQSRVSRFIPLSHYPFECEIQIYDDTVAFISFCDREEFALQVKSGPIARTMRYIWQIVWNVAY